MDGTLTIRVDSNTKAKAKLILNDLGLDLSTAINMYLKQIIKKGGIPFMIEQPNKTTLETIDKALQGIDVEGPYDSVDELFDHLDADIASYTKNKRK